MRLHTYLHARTPRPFMALVAVLGVLVVGATPAWAIETPPASSDDLAPIASVADAPAAGSVEPSGGASLLPEAPAATADDPFGAGTQTSSDDAVVVDGTVAELRVQRGALVANRDQFQTKLLALEAARERAEERVDMSLTAIATRLVELFEQRHDARLQALMAVRDEQDQELRAELVGNLYVAEYRLLVEQQAAADALASAATAADAVRLQVQTLGTRISSIDTALKSHAPASADARARGDRFTVDADYVFATGPIPGIGYWGAMNGGTMLAGWTGFAGAALGGVGCTPPQAGLQATGTIEQGEASWYGPGFNGQSTASGEIYDQTAMTAAHKTLPFGTIVRVYSNATARCAFVRITDRGPFVEGRVIDLSRSAADAIGMESIAPVQLEVWTSGGSTDASTPAAPTP